MHTPTKTQWQVVIDNFKKVLPLAIKKDHLNLMEPSVNVDHTCGTIHCIGGWYAIATCDLTKAQRWQEGAIAMAQHLGFTERWQLKHWAEESPDIWGNILGNEMFTNKDAWNGANSLSEVITFLEAVRDRSPD